MSCHDIHEGVRIWIDGAAGVMLTGFAAIVWAIAIKIVFSKDGE